MLQLRHVKKSYNKTPVLADIDFTFEEGRIYPVLGGPGAGRTTLFECICGDLSIDQGEIITPEKCDIFLAAKQSVLPMYITGYEFIQYLCELGRSQEPPETFLDRVGLDAKTRSRMICDYSFESKKRLQLAAFLVQRPYMILFDEPLDYCSQDYIDTFLGVLEAEKQGHIILISTGLLETARCIHPDLIVLNNGEFNLVTNDMIKIPEIRQAILDILGETDNDNF